MAAYELPIFTATIFFPFLAGFLLIPYGIWQYRKYGSLSKIKLLIIFSFIYYLLCAYFLIILPLPDIADVAKLTTPRYNLEPFNVVRYFLKTSVLNITQPSTYLPALKQAAFIQPFFNLVLTVPFGLYLRYIWKFSFKKVALFSFCLSLFFELTQLSGLYFIYPRSYRLFDVDDLMLNTLGGMIGFSLEPLFAKIFPPIEKLNDNATKDRQHASFWRRLLGLIIDLVIFDLLFFVAGLFNSQLSQDNYWFYSLGMFLYFVLLPYFFSGATLGKKVVKTKIVKNSGEKVSFIALFFRQFILFGVSLGILNYFIPYLLNALNNSQNTHLEFYLGLLMLAGGYLLLFVLNALVLLLKRNSKMFYEHLTKTKEIGF